MTLSENHNFQTRRERSRQIIQWRSVIGNHIIQSLEVNYGGGGEEEVGIFIILVFREGILRQLEVHSIRNEYLSARFLRCDAERNFLCFMIQPQHVEIELAVGSV